MDEVNFHFDTANYFRTLSRRLPFYIQNAPARSLFLVIIPHPISPEDKRIQTSVNTHIPKDIPVLFIAATSLLSAENTIAHIRRQLHKKISTYYPRDCVPIYTHARAYAVQNTIDVLVKDAYHAILQLWRNHATMNVLAPRWIRNIWKNISLPLRNSSVKELSTGLPTINGYACVIGAGPSLDAQVLHLLKRHRSKLILIACDTVLATLHCNGIYPDICVGLESQYYNIRDFIPPPHSSIHLLSDITAHPTTMRIFSQKTLFCTEFAPLSFFKRIAHIFQIRMPALGSVGVAGSYIAMQSNAQGIFFGGLDFAFYKGKSHCLHAPAHTTQLLTHTRCNPWQSATTHFLQKNIYPLENVNAQISKVSDKTLSTYAIECNNILKTFTKKYNIKEIYEIQNPQSMISYMRKAKTHTLDHYDSILTKASPATLQWKNIVIIKKELIRVMLKKEVQYALHISDVMTHYKQRGLTPPYKLWNTHLDFYACTLFEDAYSIKSSLQKGDIRYWKEQKLYEKIQYNAQRVVHDIRSVLKNA